MSFGDRLGLAGLIVALLAIAAFYLWPDKKWIGWPCLALAVILSLAWVGFEFQEQLGRFYGGSPFGSTLIVGVAGGVFTGILWWFLATTTFSAVTWDFDHVLGIAGGGGQEAIITRFQVHAKAAHKIMAMHIRRITSSETGCRPIFRQCYPRQSPRVHIPARNPPEDGRAGPAALHPAHLVRTLMSDPGRSNVTRRLEYQEDTPYFILLTR